MAGDKDFAGRTAVVTGGSNGLGLLVVKNLVARGARVAALARDAKRLGERLRDLGDSVLPLSVDAGDPAQVRSAFAEIAQRWGKLDFLVNNAAVGLPFAVDELPDAEIAAELGTNVAAVIYCVRSAVPLMRAAGGGVIINVSSESAERPVPGLALYGATKAAVESYSLALNGELRGDRIRSSVLRLGRMKDTGFSKGWGVEERAAAVRQWQELGRFPTDSEPMDPNVVVEVLTRLLLLPPAAQVRLVDLREFNSFL